MAFDPNSIPKFPRVTEKPRILPSVVTDLRNMDAVYASNVQDVGFQGSMPVYYPISDTAFTGLGYGGVSPTVWRPSVAAPVTYQESGSLATGIGCNMNYGVHPKPNSTISGTSERSLDSFLENRIKFLCSYGGRILPRPSDGMLRYVGGQTRIISLQKDSTFIEFSQKMITTFGRSVVVKYQLPDEDLDALVSVSCPDDFENMLEEYYKISERPSEGSSKLRLFLFPDADREVLSTSHFGDLQDDVGQQYVDAVNGILDGIGTGFKRKESIASIASTHNSDVTASEAKYSTGSGKNDMNGSSLSGVLSPKANIILSDDNIPKVLGADSGALGYIESPTIQPAISMGSITPQIVLSPSEHDPNKPSLIPTKIQKHLRLENPPSPPHHPNYLNPYPGLVLNPQISSSKGDPNLQPLGNTYVPAFTQPQPQINYSTPSHHNITVVHPEIVPPYSGSNVSGIRPLMDIYPGENSYVPQIVQFPDNRNTTQYNQYIPSPLFPGGYGFQPVLPNGHVLPGGHFVQPQVIFPAKIQRYKDCLMCQKALPHAHSDTVAQDQLVNGVSLALDSTPAHHSLCAEEDTRNHHMNTDAPNSAPAAAEQTLDPKVFKKTYDWTQNEVRSIPNNNMGVFIPNPLKSDNLDQFITSVPQGVVGSGGFLQATYDVWPSTIQQPCREDHRQHQPQGTGTFKINQEPFFCNPVASAGVFPIVSNPPFSTSEHILYEYNDISGKPPRVVPVDAAVRPSIQQGNRGISDGRDFRAFDDIPGNNNPPFDNHRKEEFLDTKMQQPYRKEFVLDGNSVIPLTSHYPNQGITPEFLAPPGTTYLQNIRPGEISEAEQYNFMGSNTTNHPMAFDEGVTGNSTNFGIESPDMTNQTSQFQQNIIPVSPKPIPFNGKCMVPTSSKPGDFQDRPTVDDPWNFRHVVSSIPYNVIKSPTKDEVDMIIDQNSVHVNNLKADTWLKDDKRQEEIIGYENQIVASGVATSVHPPTTSSQLNVCVSDKGTSNLEHKVYSEDHDYDADKFEDMKTKQPEKASFGFPVSDDIGHLQIIKNIDLEELCELGSGTFGTVYHGKWRGTDVAIKRINDRFFSGKQSEQERMRDDFWNEAIKLADLHHPNVVAFYGVVLDGPGDSVATVTEYMVNGSLRNNLQKNEKILDKRKRLLISMDVAFGMEYLHGKNIVHFDLKSDNLLVNLRDPHRPICKVGDLGLSKVKCRTLISGGVRGTLPWMAPELLNGSSSLVSEKVDVFSFGIVMWELLTGDEPYADLHYGAIIGGIVSNTLRPAVPDTCEAEWKSLMERCWSTEPFERPSFTEIAAELRSMAVPKITSPKGGGPLQHHHPPFPPK